MPQLHLTISPELDKTIDKLVEQTGGSSRSAVICGAIALLDILVETQQKGGKVLLTDKDSNPVAEITN